MQDSAQELCPLSKDTLIEVLAFVQTSMKVSEEAVRQAEEAVRGAYKQHSLLRHIERLLLDNIQKEFNHVLSTKHPDWIRVDATLSNGGEIHGWLVGGIRGHKSEDDQVWMLDNTQGLGLWYRKCMHSATRAFFALPQVVEYLAEFAPGEKRPVTADWRKFD